MKRGVLLACLLACTQSRAHPDAGPTLDAAAPLGVVVKINGSSHVYVVRGESVHVRFTVSGPDASSVESVGAVGLPPGLTSDPAVPDGLGMGSVTIHARADADRADVTADIITGAATTASASFRLTVVGVDGSLDPSFGTDGVMPLSQTGVRVVGLAAQNARMLVAGSVYESPIEHVWLARLLEDGTLDPTFGAAGVVDVTTADQGTIAESLVACDDGSVAVIASDDVAVDEGLYSAETRALLFDGTGALASNVLLPFAPQDVACVGGSLFGVSGKALIVVDATKTVHVSALPEGFLRLAASPPVVDVAANDVVQLSEDVPGHYVVDTTFGDRGSVPAAWTIDSIVRDHASNVLFAWFDTVPLVDVFALLVGPSSGDVFVVSESPKFGELAITRVDSSGKLVATFGDLGTTKTSLLSSTTTLAGAALDSVGRMWAVLTNGTLVRYRLVAP